ncbi:MAG: helix-turn-helix domain-containing protein [Clostridiales bacterium]|nr:helix-turn-helix domain-containing protein [Clostridiales bacterium]
MAVKRCGYPQIDTVGTGKRLRYLSHKKGISVQEIQHSLGLASNQAVYEWFNGKCLPTLNNFFALSKLLDLPMEDMLILRENLLPEETHRDISHCFCPYQSGMDPGENQMIEEQLLLEEGCYVDTAFFSNRMRKYDMAILERCA